MQTRCFIDWLSFTLPIKRALLFGELWDFVAHTTRTYYQKWTRCGALYGYDMAFSYGVGVIAMAHSYRPEMGVHFQLSGQGIGTLLGNYGAVYVFLDELKKIGAKVTRIDVAIDVFDSGLKIGSLADALKWGEARTSSAKHMLIRGSDGGETLYIGSRQSERFCRIYNKAAERLAQGADNDQSSDWIRIELEVKADKAKALFHTLTNDDQLPHETIQAWIKAFIDFPDEKVWRAILGRDNVRMEISHRKLTNSRKWLLGTVCDAIAKELVKDPSFAPEIQSALLLAIEEQIRLTLPQTTFLTPVVTIEIKNDM
jgi:hypothetical protein